MTPALIMSKIGYINVERGSILSEYIKTGIIIPGAIVDRVLKIGFSPTM